VSPVQSALGRVRGVKEAKVSLETQEAVVRYDPEQAKVEDLIKAVKEARGMHPHRGCFTGPTNVILVLFDSARMVIREISSGGLTTIDDGRTAPIAVIAREILRHTGMNCAKEYYKRSRTLAQQRINRQDRRFDGSECFGAFAKLRR
jgi:Heavy-metal-associated domain